MAKPIAIVPIPADNQQGAKDQLLRKLDEAPLEHAPALLALWNLLEAAHEKQLIEIATGARTPLLIPARSKACAT
jgi:hypothetical protein